LRVALCICWVVSLRLPRPLPHPLPRPPPPPPPPPPQLLHLPLETLSRVATRVPPAVPARRRRMERGLGTGPTSTAATWRPCRRRRGLQGASCWPVPTAAARTWSQASCSVPSVVRAARCVLCAACSCVRVWCWCVCVCERFALSAAAAAPPFPHSISVQGTTSLTSGRLLSGSSPVCRHCPSID
jgi:hypothetical protein